MQPLIITCAITGAETSKQKQPALPITPQEQAIEAEKCVAAGASIIHLHVREDDGTPSQRPERFGEAIEAIRKRVPQVIIQISTGGAIGESIENRARPLTLKPEMASLNVGTMNFGEEVFMNAPKEVAGMAEQIAHSGVVPELEIYEMGHLESAIGLIKKGLVKPPYHFQYVLGVPGGMGGELSHLLYLKERTELLMPTVTKEPFTWGVAGVGRFQLPLNAHAILLGGHVRTGLEDNVFYRKGELATSNAQFVERIVRLARELGREIATPEQARAMMLS